MSKKKLVLTIDVSHFSAEWQVKAIQMQLMDSFKKNGLFIDEDVILWPVRHEPFTIFWINSDCSPEQEKELRELKDKITPILQETLNITLPIIAEETLKKIERMDKYIRNMGVIRANKNK